MASILSQRFQQQNNNQQNIMAQLAQIRQAGPSNAMFNRLYQGNPNFRQFADSMKGKTPEQAFRENGLNFNQFRHMKW